MMPYEPRPLSLAPVQRPAPGPQFLTTSNPYPPTPIAAVTAPYPPPVTYSGYGSFHTPPVLSPPPRPQTMYHPHHIHRAQERPQPRIISVETDSSRSFPDSAGGGRLVAMEGRSPSVKRERKMSTGAMSTTSNRSAASRVIVSNTPVNGASTIEFNTPLDALMKTIQAKGGECDVLPGRLEATQEDYFREFKIESRQPMSPEQLKPHHELQQGLAPEDAEKRADDAFGLMRKYHCDIPGCSKRFQQKTHLEIHRRAHTGDKPYICKVCGDGFSQLGNLKTHLRRHTGEKPYRCGQCGKSFAQRGNVKAHMQTHQKTKPFICKLDNCNKAFTQLGNLKSHQNKFHIDTVTALTAKFAAAADAVNASDADKELLAYFASLYKNSNKGIKGRGKHRKVEPVGSQPRSSPPSPTSPVHSPFPVHIPNVLPQLHTTQPLPHPLPYHGLSHPAAYSMSRPNFATLHQREPQNCYQICDHDETSLGSSAPAPSAGGHLYDDEHHRELAFGDRMY